MNTFGHPSYRLVDTCHSTDPLDSGRVCYSVSLGSSFRADNRIHLCSNDYRIETKKSKEIEHLCSFLGVGSMDPPRKWSRDLWWSRDLSVKFSRIMMFFKKVFVFRDGSLDLFIGG